MEQGKSASDSRTGAPSTGAALPLWLRAPNMRLPLGRRATMLEHMARARPQSQRQAAVSPTAPFHKSGRDLFADFLGHVVLFGIIGLLFQSRFPLCLGLYSFFTDEERVEWAFRKIGIRFEPETIGPDLLKCFVSWLGWIWLLASWKDSAPAWLAPWMPPSASWSFVGGAAFVFAIVEAISTAMMRRTLPWLGLEIRPDSLGWTAIKFLAGACLLAALISFDNATSIITNLLARL
ncbi:hypothetical protein [Bradyrhizobium neotropicale]|uniref:Uncharacterized protein n=1 Tax=Bradyrhizobium neotropicale TaxID=1497615 RepID=A0A176ZIH2_9BRAD|nr:hypothetical protein [Bradyrhizobium neotropicale]OAF19585.1 hypothetical protein AXW67_02090 [Bradyrhizobium neotropicale]